MKGKNCGCQQWWKDGSAHKYLLLLQRIWVQLPAPTQRLTTICNSSSDDPTPDSGLREQWTHIVHKHTCTQNINIHMQTWPSEFNPRTQGGKMRGWISHYSPMAGTHCSSRGGRLSLVFKVDSSQLPVTSVPDPVSGLWGDYTHVAHISNCDAINN